jgi:alcohol dehydrogenase (cytochrome c)
MKNLLIAITTCLLPAAAAAQGLNPADILKPLANDWPTYSGDYSGRRYSKLTQINQSNVTHLTLAWTARLTGGAGGGGGGRGGRGFGGAPVIVAGEGTADVGAGGGGTTVKGAVLQVNGILYVSTPDNAWAIDAIDGRELWHFFWKT